MFRDVVTAFITQRGFPINKGVVKTAMQYLSMYWYRLVLLYKIFSIHTRNLKVIIDISRDQQLILNHVVTPLTTIGLGSIMAAKKRSR